MFKDWLKRNYYYDKWIRENSQRIKGNCFEKNQNEILKLKIRVSEILKSIIWS